MQNTSILVNFIPLIVIPYTIVGNFRCMEKTFATASMQISQENFHKWDQIHIVFSLEGFPLYGIACAD